MKPNIEYLRQLEARVRTLENENKILRAALENSNALSEYTRVGTAPAAGSILSLAAIQTNLDLSKGWCTKR